MWNNVSSTCAIAASLLSATTSNFLKFKTFEKGDSNYLPSPLKYSNLELKDN
jgi:hypothetical protein